MTVSILYGHGSEIGLFMKTRHLPFPGDTCSPIQQHNSNCWKNASAPTKTCFSGCKHQICVVMGRTARRSKHSLLLFGRQVPFFQSQWNRRNEFRAHWAEGMCLVKLTWMADRESATRVLGSWGQHQRMCTLVQMYPLNTEQSSCSAGNSNNATRNREGRATEKVH